VWCGEFGRTPEAQGRKGRDYNNTGFSMFMAGVDIKVGQAVEATDEIGLRAKSAQLHLPGPPRTPDRSLRRRYPADRLSAFFGCGTCLAMTNAFDNLKRAIYTFVKQRSFRF
jgi:hypothetical protein